MTWSIYGRFLTTDIPAIASRAVPLWAFWRAWERGENGSRVYLFAFSAALAAGVLTWGLLALVFPAITMFALWTLRRGRLPGAGLAVTCGTMFAILGVQQAVSRFDPYLSMREVSGALRARNGIWERLIVDGYYEIHEGLDSYAGRSLYEGLHSTRVERSG